MEELIPIIFFILWFLFGTVGSKKKREEAARRREEAQRTAREREAQRRQRLEQRRVDTTVRTAAERARAEATQARESSEASASGTSLDMVPDELWAILTGGAPRPTAPPPSEARREPVPEGGWVTSPPWDEDDAVHSIEGVSTEAEFGDETDYDDEADRIARARYENITAVSWDTGASARREAESLRQSETSDARHVEFHDALRASEIGAAAPLDRGRNTRERLGLQGMDDVRRAIVLAEVLGPPKSLRSLPVEPRG